MHAPQGGSSRVPCCGSNGCSWASNDVRFRSNFGRGSLCVVSVECSVAEFGGPDFDNKLVTIPGSDLTVSIDGDHSNLFALSARSSCQQIQVVPIIHCFVKDHAAKDKWADIFRRRGVSVEHLIGAGLLKVRVPQHITA